MDISVQDRLERIEAELAALIEECRDGGQGVAPVARLVAGRICMAQFFARRALDDMRRRREIPLGGRDRSVPRGDRA
ncbi:hypothetical protein [Pseudodesulfovibrio pelocollis]|uniref:hypothetical protein n=1 Tax=Pseudodesulfovibrio pelocollis TaxID=3051432 RepID=UPI00255B28F6|nr:hypothetical protein [Pseudodesulfovibrio sp. SB368]